MGESVKVMRKVCMFLWVCGLVVWLASPFYQYQFYSLTWRIVGIIGFAGAINLPLPLLFSSATILGKVCRVLVFVVGAMMIFAALNHLIR